MTEHSTELSTRAPDTGLAAASLPDRMNYARALSQSGLLPTSFRDQPANVLIGIELAVALQMAPIIVLNELAVISGRPSWSAKFMRALVRRAGHKLRESYKDGVATSTIIRADDPSYEHSITWDQAKAVQHGYWNQGHWKKNPVLMLKNRALSEAVREACPEVLVGVAYTDDELADFVPGARQSAELTVEVQEPAQATPAPTPPNRPAKAQEAAQAPTQAQGDDVQHAVPVTDSITPAQSKAMGAAMGAVGLRDRQPALDYVAAVIDRTVASRNELTKAEASAVIDALNRGFKPEEVVDAEFVEDVPATTVDDVHAQPWPVDPETGEVAQ